MIPRQPAAKKYEVSPFMANSRLVKSLPPSSYSVEPTQAVDIKCRQWSVLVLSMQYHLKFPRYISNKLAELHGKCDEARTLLLVIIETPQ